jgi:catechol 2,3-dioxygenase-like lactoylglutathione lyase family enzyme
VRAVECRRFLHTNYNCTDLDELERWYTEVFGLRALMRSGGEEAPADAFGIYQPTTSYVSFLYDHRGGRRATSLELVRWTDPPTAGRPYPRAWDRGIQSYGYQVPDVDDIVRRAEAKGGRLVRRADRGALLRDPQGVAVEVVDADTEQAEAHHLRIVCTDVDQSVDWYGRIGLQPSPDAVVVSGAALWEGDAEHVITREVAIAASDDPTFSLILTAWSGPDPIGPTYGMPFHQGLYRMAIAVDDVADAYASLREAGIARQPPTTFALPGTPITEGLTILFIRDPDGILVELVERPRSYFRT